MLDRLPAGGFCDWARDVLPAMLADGDRLAAYRTDAYWSDIGTVADLLRANLDCVSGALGLGGGAGIDADGRDRPERVDRGPRRDRRRRARRRRTSASPGPSPSARSARIGAGAALRDAVVLPRSTVAPGALVLGGIVGDIATLA